MKSSANYKDGITSRTFSAGAKTSTSIVRVAFDGNEAIGDKIFIGNLPSTSVLLADQCKIIKRTSAVAGSFKIVDPTGSATFSAAIAIAGGAAVGTSVAFTGGDAGVAISDTVEDIKIAAGIAKLDKKDELYLEITAITALAAGQEIVVQYAYAAL